MLRLLRYYFKQGDFTTGAHSHYWAPRPCPFVNILTGRTYLIHPLNSVKNPTHKKVKRVDLTIVGVPADDQVYTCGGGGLKTSWPMKQHQVEGLFIQFNLTEFPGVRFDESASHIVSKSGN